MSRTFLGTLVPWLAAAGVDAYAALGTWPRPRWWQFALEIGLLALAGRTQWRLARGWLRTPYLAAVVMAFFAATLHVPTQPIQLVPCLIGLVVSLLWLGRAAARWLPSSPALGACVAVLVVVGARYLDAVAPTQPQFEALRSTVEDFTWPMRLFRTPDGTSDGPPVVLISVDTLRADDAATMQTVARLAARGASWERAMSTANWTLPALASLQSGRMPVEHGAGCLTGGHCQGIAPHVRMLAEDLRAAGYATGAVVTNPWITAGTGFGRGFETFVESGNTLKRLLVGGVPAGPYRQDAQYVVDAALDWLATAPARGFYLWVHVVDPHMPYRHSSDPEWRALTSVSLRTSIPVGEEQARAIRAAYRGEVAYVDRQLGRLVDALERRGVLDDGAVVFTADHGEEFWEHGGVEHGHSHHGEVVDVPLVVVAPGVEPGPRPGVASLLDVPSTIRAVAGLPPGGIDLRSAVPPDRIATAWGGIVMHIDCSARDAGRRAIARDCAGELDTVDVFDLRADPGEHDPLPGSPADPVARAALGIAAPPRADAALVNRAELRMLGYVQ